MAVEAEKVITCEQCKRFPCLYGYPEGIPEWCQGQRFPELLEKAVGEYLQPEMARVHVATAKVLKEADETWSRLKETIEFARALGVSRIGVAVCTALLREGAEVSRFLKRAGFEVVCVGCMIGGASDRGTGVPEEYCTPRGTICNPIAQAEILNQAGTELNLAVGLCVGHDILFAKAARAPVTTFTVKDRATGNNPSAALFSPFIRQALWRQYGGGG